MTKKRPMQVDLIPDRAIKPLDEIAASYAELRDRRMELTTEEAALKDTAIKLMHKYKKTTYRHNGIEIRLEPGEENVKVRVKKDAESSDEPDDEPPDRIVADEGA